MDPGGHQLLIQQTLQYNRKTILMHSELKKQENTDSMGNYNILILHTPCKFTD